MRFNPALAQFCAKPLTVPHVFALVPCAYLVVDEAGLLAGVLVDQVEGVTGELDTAISLALDEEAVVVTCRRK